VAYGDALAAEYNGELYCHFDDEIWIWRQGLYCWVAIETWPTALIVINGRVAILDEDTGEYYCNCPRYVLPQSGCVCGGK